ncbi:hypothetical protein Slin15195_G041860 [Septoria linicola]|uniref:Uncharacterized protein n=1 Tax=Septoria linicola TaxID=215465 RepID=A0A9Q9EIB8_9PEZI|nr:hypothetical protein Slin14017_G045370 [Septoria linicola]USW50867.1 hypothetical protein Slin15195_G041860 [Septoria linicola]
MSTSGWLRYMHFSDCTPEEILDSEDGSTDKEQKAGQLRDDEATGVVLMKKVTYSKSLCTAEQEPEENALQNLSH